MRLFWTGNRPPFFSDKSKERLFQSLLGLAHHDPQAENSRRIHFYQSNDLDRKKTFTSTDEFLSRLTNFDLYHHYYQNESTYIRLILLISTAISIQIPKIINWLRSVDNLSWKARWLVIVPWRIYSEWHHLLTTYSTSFIEQQRSSLSKTCRISILKRVWLKLQVFFLDGISFEFISFILFFLFSSLPSISSSNWYPLRWLQVLVITAFSEPI